MLKVRGFMALGVKALPNTTIKSTIRNSLETRSESLSKVKTQLCLYPNSNR